MKETLEVTQTIDGVTCRIIAKGRIDANNAELLQNKLDEVLKDGQKSIILNMAQIEYLSSIGVRIILKTYKEALKVTSTFKIESPSKIVKNVLGMVALKQLLVT